jgi:F-type H+-transporting ATPase subunit beta
MMRPLDVLISLVPGPSLCRGMPFIDPKATTSPWLREEIVGEEPVRIATAARASLQQLDAFEALGATAQADVMRSDKGRLIERAQQLRLYLVQPLFYFEQLTQVHGYQVPIRGTLKSIKDILSGELDGIAAPHFALVGGLEEVRARAAGAPTRTR